MNMIEIGAGGITGLFFLAWTGCDSMGVYQIPPILEEASLAWLYGRYLVSHRRIVMRDCDPKSNQRTYQSIMDVIHNQFKMTESMKKCLEQRIRHSFSPMSVSNS
jgi:hypothetical protein